MLAARPPRSTAALSGRPLFPVDCGTSAPGELDAKRPPKPHRRLSLPPWPPRPQVYFRFRSRVCGQLAAWTIQFLSGRQLQTLF